MSTARSLRVAISLVVLAGAAAMPLVAGQHLLTAMIYISDFSQKEGMNEAWLEWLPGELLPTRATIGVADLGENVLIEVVVSAAKTA